MEYTVVVLGAGGVGKTSLVTQFIHGIFPVDYNPTVEDCYRHVMKFNDGLYHTVEILDTAGTHPFPAMRDLSIRTGSAFVIVYSVSNEDSFIEAINIGHLIREIKGKQDVPIVLVGNKVDLSTLRRVPTESGQKHASESLRCDFQETSAKYNFHVNDLFVSLLSQAHESKSKVGLTKHHSLIPPKPNDKGSLKRHSSDGGGQRSPVVRRNSKIDGKCVLL